MVIVFVFKVDEYELNLLSLKSKNCDWLIWAQDNVPESSNSSILEVCCFNELSL